MSDTELTQSRLKRKPYWDFDELYLDVTLSCLERDNDLGYVFVIYVSFRKQTRAVEVAYEPDNYGTFGIVGDNTEARCLLETPSACRSKKP